MKTLICCLILLFPLICPAQDFSLAVSGDGIYLNMATTRTGNTYVVERAVGNGKFRELTTLEVPTSREEVVLLLEEAEAFFPSSRPINERADVIWEQLETGQADSSAESDPAIRIALGLAYRDTDLRDGERYRYRINTTISSIQYRKPARFRGRWSRITETESHRYPVLRWFSMDAFDASRIRILRTSYNQEEAEIIETFHMVFRSPSGDTVFIQLQDTSLQQEGYYTYRIQPLDRLGNPGEEPTSVSLTWLRDDQRPKVIRLEAEEAILRWDLRHPELVRSLHVYRGKTMEGPFERLAILPPESREYQDRDLPPMEAVFYYLVVNDVHGEHLRSMVTGTIDTPELPASPPDLVQTHSTSEGVEVGWNAAVGSVRGYYIYRSEGYRGEWELASDFLPRSENEQTWLDTLPLLQPGKVYSYAVQTESETYQKSALSERSSVRIIGVQEVPSVHWIESRSTSEGVVIRWEDLFARVPALQTYALYRSLDDGEAELIADTLSRRTNRFIDTEAPSGALVYRLVARDIYGNESAPSQGAYLVHEEGFVGGPALTAVGLETGILLKWTSPESGIDWQLYRSVEGGDWEAISPVLREGQFLDQAVRTGSMVQYRISTPERSGDPILIRF